MDCTPAAVAPVARPFGKRAAAWAVSKQEDLLRVPLVHARRHGVFLINEPNFAVLRALLAGRLPPNASPRRRHEGDALWQQRSPINSRQLAFGPAAFVATSLSKMDQACIAPILAGRPAG